MSNIVLALLAGFFNGVGDFFTKMSAGKISPYIGGIILSVCAAIPSLIYLLFIKGLAGNTMVTKLGIVYSALGGLTIGVGVVCFFVLFNRGVNISSMQPIIKTMVVMSALLLGLIVLREKLGLIQVIGLGFSVVGIYLMTK
jgi:uncharacterized membrane protein